LIKWEIFSQGSKSAENLAKFWFFAYFYFFSPLRSAPLETRSTAPRILNPVFSTTSFRTAEFSVGFFEFCGRIIGKVLWKTFPTICFTVYNSRFVIMTKKILTHTVCDILKLFTPKTFTTISICNHKICQWNMSLRSLHNLFCLLKVNKNSIPIRLLNSVSPSHIPPDLENFVLYLPKLRFRKHAFRK